MIDYILDFFKTTLPVWMFALIFVVVFVLSLFSEKIKEKFQLLAVHPRSRIAFWYTAGLPIILIVVNVLWEDALILSACVCGAFLIVFWLFTFVCTPVFLIVKLIYTRLYNQGKAIEYFKSLQKWQWCLVSKKDKISYTKLISSFSCITHSHVEANNAFQKIPIEWLLDKEEKKNTTYGVHIIYGN